MKHRQWVTKLTGWGVLVVGLFAVLPSFAASLDVRPTLLQLLPGQKVGVVYLINQDDQPHTYQIKSFRWFQVDADQHQEPTDDIIANPAIVELQPKQTQIVRFGLRTAVPSAPEVAYRLIVDEVPADAANTGGSSLNVLLRISLPLFVRTLLRPPPPDLAAAWTENGHSLTLSVSNHGVFTARVVRAVVEGDGAPAGLELTQLHYVLPGGRTDFVFTLPQAWTPHHARVTLATDIGEVTLPLGPGG